MKKLLFTFFALILCTSLGWGATVTKTMDQFKADSSATWTELSAHPYLQLDGNISVSATHDPSYESYPNGTISFSAAPTKWYAYQKDNNGEFTITSSAGCIIQTITITQSPKNNAIISRTPGKSQTAIATNEPVNAKSITLYCANSGDGSNGQARITQFSVTYKGEYFKQSDVTIGLINKGYKNVNLSSISGDAPLSYGSSKESVATVTDEGVITPVGEGETTITAYYGANKTGYSTTYTLHVSKGIYYEAFSSTAIGSDLTSIQGDAYDWTANAIARRAQDTLATGQQGLWLKAEKYIQTTTNVEGGVKDITLKWKQFGAESGSTLKMAAQWGETSVELFSQAAGSSPYPDRTASKEIKMKTNGQLKLLNTSTGTTNRRIVLADIQFTPYLLFINKNQSVDCASKQTFDFSPYIIDNTSATPTYSVTDDGGTGCAGNFTGSVLDLSDVCKSGKMVITASWEGVSTTDTLTVTAKPAPTSITLNGGNPLAVTVGNRFQITSSILPAGSNQNVVWSSSAPENVSVDQNGVISIHNADGATITLTSKADPNVKGECVISAVANNDESFTENGLYSGIKEKSAFDTEAAQAYTASNGINWVVRYYKRNSSTTIGDPAVQGVELDNASSTQSGGSGKVGYVAYNDNQEGGIKRVSFDWRAVTDNKKVILGIHKTSAGTPDFVLDLPAGTYTSPQTYSVDVNYEQNGYLRIRNNSTASGTSVIVGPITVTPYLLYKTKTAETNLVGYKNTDLINNIPAGDAVTYSLEENDGVAEINPSTGEITKILKSGTVTVKASWNEGKVYTTYSLTVSALPIPVITFGNTTIDAFGSYTPEPTAEVGGAPISDAQWTYTSSNAAVATVNEGVFTITGAGTSTITATLVGTSTYASKSAEATLTVNEPTVGVWKEKYDSLGSTGSAYNKEAEPTYFYSKDKAYRWQARNYQYNNADNNKVNGEDGIRIRKEDNDKNYIATATPLEGGVKAVFFNWQMAGGSVKTSDFTVSVTETHLTDYSEPVQIEVTGGQYRSYVDKSVDYKANGMFRVKINSAEKAAVFGPMIIKPYLLYTRKDTTIKAMDYTAASHKFTFGSLINNTNGEGEITYSIEDAVNKAGIATIDDPTKGEVTIQGDGTVKVIAKWKHDPVNAPLDSVTTSYNLTILLRSAGVKFAHKDTTVYLKDGGSYTQEVAKACASAVPVYSFEGEYGTCGINSATGEVTFTEPDTIVVKATVPQVLPYKGGSATYTLRINKSDINPDDLSFQQAGTIEKDMNDAPFTNALTGVPAEGAGAVTYKSDKENVAKVDNSGQVTIVGAGTATITATVTEGAYYKSTSKDYTINVSEPTGEESYTETFAAYQDGGWTSSGDGSREGDKITWDVKEARRAAGDVLADATKRATWINREGYLQTNFEGGVKRVSFEWNKFWSPAVTIKMKVVAGDIEDNVTQSFEEGDTRYATDLSYSHNFGVKKNCWFKIMNNSEYAESGGNKGPRMLVGDIKITPYIFYPKRNDTILAADYTTHPFAPIPPIDNTGGDGTITYSSDNTDVAVPLTNGNITIKGYSEKPVKITMTWQPSDQAESVSTSFYLKIDDKQDRQAEFAQSDMTVARGEVINDVNNKLTIHTVSGDVPSTPAYTLESADTCVAKVIDGEVHTIAPGNTVITAHIDATSKCKALDISYTLHVTYQPTGQYWYETMKNIQGGKGDKATTETVNGEDGIANKWKVTNVFYKDQINGKTGTRVRYSSSIATNEGVVLEGGIKEVLFSWCVFNNSFPTHFTVTAGSTPYEYRHGILASKDDVQPFAHDFNVKSNATLSISNAADEKDTPEGSQSHIIIDSIKVVPYLLYTRKDTIIKSSEMGGVYTFTNDKLINNTGDAVAANFTFKVLAKDNAVKIADADLHTGKLTIIGAGTDTIEAAWEGVKTTYVVHVVLEDAGLDFTEKTPVVLLGTGSYTQTASKSTTAAVKYEFEEGYDSGTATINETTGEVTFKGQTGELHILASVPVALPYNLDSARYVLTVNNKPTPTVVFDPKTVDMNAEAFTPEAKTIPSSGMGTASYVSSNLEVAKIEEGKVTIVGEGTSTISVHYDEGGEWGEADVDFLLTVTDVLYEDSIKESFANDADWQKACTTVIDVDGLFGWKTYLTRHRSSGDSPDRLASGEQATWFNNSGNAYLKSANAIEGGIKRVAFNWKKETVTANVPSFTVKVDNEPLVVDATDRTGVDQRFNHNYFVKKNVALEIDNNTASLLRVGAIKITPYLYYETKKCTLDLKVKDNFKNEDLIDNRDDKATSSISYSIIAGNEGSIAEIAEDGTVTATAGGEITVQAQWSSNTSVTTTYTLTILPSKTTINLMRNDDTSDKDVIENTIGQVMPEITLPTRDGYRFNAYFIDQACTAKRFTVTTLTYTGWVSNITYPKNGVKYTGDDRIWIYSGNEAVTLYADWKPERTITLDNQEATEAGTEEVVTAYCENNNLVNLMDPITIPQKENHIFRGYYTEEEGAGTQLIDANGAFIANVTGYTDTEKNYKKWIKDEDITLYAKWEKAIELKDNENNEAKLTPLVESGESITFYLTRSFTAGEYNTICLPFNVNAATMEDKFGTYELATLDSTKSASLDDNEKNLSIYIVAEDSIKAGLPYLIKLATPVSNPSFENVVVKCAKGDSISSADDESKQVRFCGLLSPKSVPANKSVLFVVKNDKLAWNATGEAKNMNGMRAYFHVNGIGNVTSVSPRLVLRQPTTPTELMQNAQCTMQGVQKVLINDQIYIIRNGVYYNVSGQIVR